MLVNVFLVAAIPLGVLIVSFNAIGFYQQSKGLDPYWWLGWRTVAKLTAVPSVLFALLLILAVVG